MRDDIKPGGTFPDYALPNQAGDMQRLSDLQGIDPMVLILSRGGFHDPMIPHTLILEPGLKIFKVYNGYWFSGRSSPADIWYDLREVSQRVRPD
jgi:hypothetical protein